MIWAADIPQRDAERPEVRSHAERGNEGARCLRGRDAERPDVRSHAERGNEKFELWEPILGMEFALFQPPSPAQGEW